MGEFGPGHRRRPNCVETSRQDCARICVGAPAGSRSSTRPRRRLVRPRRRMQQSSDPKASPVTNSWPRGAPSSRGRRSNPPGPRSSSGEAASPMTRPRPTRSSSSAPTRPSPRASGRRGRGQFGCRAATARWRCRTRWPRQRGNGRSRWRRPGSSPPMSSPMPAGAGRVTDPPLLWRTEARSAGSARAPSPTAPGRWPTGTARRSACCGDAKTWCDAAPSAHPSASRCVLTAAGSYGSPGPRARRTWGHSPSTCNVSLRTFSSSWSMWWGLQSGPSCAGPVGPRCWRRCTRSRR